MVSRSRAAPTPTPTPPWASWWPGSSAGTSSWNTPSATWPWPSPGPTTRAASSSRLRLRHPGLAGHGPAHRPQLVDGSARPGLGEKLALLAQAKAGGLATARPFAELGRAEGRAARLGFPVDRRTCWPSSSPCGHLRGSLPRHQGERPRQRHDGGGQGRPSCSPSSASAAAYVPASNWTPLRPARASRASRRARPSSSSPSSASTR